MATPIWRADDFRADGRARASQESSNHWKHACCCPRASAWRRTSPGATGLRLMGNFTLGGAFPALDASHTVDLTNSTLAIPYTGTSILPLIRSLLSERAVFNSSANDSCGKFALADSDNGSQVTLEYSLVGDVNGDGSVNFSDLLILAQNYNRTGVDWAHGDLTYDGAVGFADLLALAQHYGQSSATESFTTEARRREDCKMQIAKCKLEK